MKRHSMRNRDGGGDQKCHAKMTGPSRLSLFPASTRASALSFSTTISLLAYSCMRLSLYLSPPVASCALIYKTQTNGSRLYLSPSEGPFPAAAPLVLTLRGRAGFQFLRFQSVKCHRNLFEQAAIDFVRFDAR